MPLHLKVYLCSFILAYDYSTTIIAIPNRPDYFLKPE